jgi:hypothetical protein
MLVTLSEAGRIEGAPLQPSLYRMTKNQVVPSFLKKTDDGWRVDTDEPEWGNFLAGKRGQSKAGNTAKRVGASIGGKRGQKKEKEEKDDETVAADAEIRKAINSKIVWNARREKLKMEQDEIKTAEMKGAFVERSEGEYWLSFMQRGIIDSFASVDRCFSEVKRLVLQGNDTEGKQYLRNELKRGFERVVEDMREAVNGADYD